MPVFTLRKVGKGVLVGNYCGTLVYTHLGCDAQKKKTYGEGVLGVTVADF